MNHIGGTCHNQNSGRGGIKDLWEIWWHRWEYHSVIPILPERHGDGIINIKVGVWVNLLPIPVDYRSLN